MLVLHCCGWLCDNSTHKAFPHALFFIIFKVFKQTSHCCHGMAALQEQVTNNVIKAQHQVEEQVEFVSDKVRQTLGLSAPLPDKIKQTQHKIEVSSMLV